MAKLRPIEPPSGISCSLSATSDDELDACALVVAFHGVYPPGSQGNQHARWMEGCVAGALLASDHVSAVVIDLSGLEYVWGDELTRAFDHVEQRKLPLAVVEGPRCTEALRTLMIDERRPIEGLVFADVDAAIAAVMRRVR